MCSGVGVGVYIYGVRKDVANKKLRSYVSLDQGKRGSKSVRKPRDEGGRCALEEQRRERET
jgi:hypothetical protein